MLDTEGVEFSQDNSYLFPETETYHIAFDFVWATGQRTKDGRTGRHAALSNVLKRWFSPRAIRGISEQVERDAAALLREIVEKGTGKTDLASEFAYPLAMRTIMTMLGLPMQSGPWLAEHITSFVSLPMAEQVLPAPQEVEDFLWDVIHVRQRGDSQGQLIDVLIAAWTTEAITGRELLGALFGMAEAGNDSTAASIANLLAVVAEDGLLPEAAERRDDDAWVRCAVEESLRFVPSFPAGLSHTVTEVRLVDGIVVPADTPVSLWFSAANRDPNVFNKPDTFDHARWPNPHMGFGVGFHRCLGAELARLEMRRGFRAALRALPGLDLDRTEPFERTAGMVDNVMAPFEFDQQAAQALLP